MQYFKKVSPQTKVLLSSGQWLAFQPVDPEWGIYPPEGQGISEWLIGEIRAAISAARGGITEIDLSEYQELVQKKNRAPLRRQWREEIAKGKMGETASSSNAQRHPEARAVAGANAVAEALHNPRPVETNVPERPTASKRPKTS